MKVFIIMTELKLLNLLLKETGARDFFLIYTNNTLIEGNINLHGYHGGNIMI